jgi:AraC-like DNA-binding protein
MAVVVRARVLEQLPRGGASGSTVAKTLDMSLRSLQRKLSAEGTSFKEILDETRHELAARYIEESDLPMREITSLLGFADPSNFTRAFRRWEGMPPDRYRLSRRSEGKDMRTRP